VRCLPGMVSTDFAYWPGGSGMQAVQWCEYRLRSLRVSGVVAQTFRHFALGMCLPLLAWGTSWHTGQPHYAAALQMAGVRGC